MSQCWRGGQSDCYDNAHSERAAENAIRDFSARCLARKALHLPVRGLECSVLQSAFVFAVPSEWAVARAALPSCWHSRGGRQLHLFRLANEESMRDRQHGSLLSVEVGQS